MKEQYIITKKELLSNYNIGVLLLIYALVCVGPFAGGGAVGLAFLLSCYRIIRNNAQSYILDMVILLPLSNIYKLAPATPSVYLYLLLLGGIVFPMKKQMKISIYLLVMLLFFLLESGFVMDIFLSIAASLVFMVIYSTNITSRLVKKIAVFFCLSVAVSSLWAIIATPTGVFEPYTLNEIELSKGSDLLRFKGLFVDPNYFGTFLLIAITIAVQLYLSKLISLWQMVILVFVDVMAGLMTYSKSFLLVLIVLILLFCVYVWKNKSKIVALGISLAAFICISYAFKGEFSSINIILERFEGQTDLNEITTGRLDLWVRYFEEIISSFKKFFVGHGLDAPLLIQGSHNLYLETLYYIGFVGFMLLVGFVCSLFKPFIKQNKKYVGGLACVVFLALYWSLQGLFAFMTYVQLCIVMSMFLLPNLNKNIQ